MKGKNVTEENTDRAAEAWREVGLRRSGARAGVLVFALSLVATALVACGGGSPTPGAAAADGTTSSSGDPANTGLELAQCMRSHGVPDFPDQSSSSSVHIPANLNPNSSTFQSAEKACSEYWPAGTLSPAQTSQHNAGMLRFAQCMRAHGVTNFADPSVGPNGVDSFIPNPSIDTNSPTFQSARSACQGAQGAGGGGNGS
jgi:hypothetical protein